MIRLPKYYTKHKGKRVTEYPPRLAVNYRSISQHKYSMTKNHCVRLRVIVMFFLPFLRVSDTETIAEDFSHGFQRHAFALRVEENHEQPTDKADTSIETEGPTRSPGFHHRKKSRSDNNVGTPARNSILSFWLVGSN